MTDIKLQCYDCPHPPDSILRFSRSSLHDLTRKARSEAPRISSHSSHRNNHLDRHSYTRDRNRNPDLAIPGVP